VHESGSRQGEQPQKANLGEAATPAPAPASEPALVAAPAGAAALIERRRASDSQNAIIYALQRKGMFGVTVVSAFLGGALLRSLIANR